MCTTTATASRAASTSKPSVRSSCRCGSRARTELSTSREMLDAVEPLVSAEFLIEAVGAVLRWFAAGAPKLSARSVRHPHGRFQMASLRYWLTIVVAICFLAAPTPFEQPKAEQQKGVSGSVAQLMPKTAPSQSTIIGNAVSACGGPIDNPCSSSCERRDVGGSSGCTRCRSCGNQCGDTVC